MKIPPLPADEQNGMVDTQSDMQYACRKTSRIHACQIQIAVKHRTTLISNVPVQSHNCQT